MSVGLSQVNFDAQALEDEEEAAFEKEDQEREKELRELISNELDDDLLDDDNASFSSHDFRSSSRSRDTPISGLPPDSPPQQWNGQYGHSGNNDTAFSQYSARIPGGFERPPLVTPKGFQLLKGNPSDNGHEQIHGKNPNYEYQDEDSIQFHQIPNEFHQQQNEEHDLHPRVTDYHRYGNYGAVAFRNYEETRHPSAFQSYFPRGRFEGQHDNGEFEEGENVDVSNVIGGYDVNERGYIDQSDHEAQHTDQHREGHYGPVNQGKTYAYVGDGPQDDYGMQNTEIGSNSDHMVLGKQGIGEQRVKYLKRQLPSDESGEGHVISDAQTRSSNSQLEILYRARGRKIEELSQQLEEKEEEIGKEIRMLNHQLALIKGEHAGMATSLEQAQKIIVGNKNEINELKSKLTSAIQERDTVQQEKEEVEQKLNAAESAVESLNQQVVELSRSESLQRAKEQNENLLDSIRKKHQDEILKLRQKLDENAVNLEWKTEETNRLRDELAQSRRETDYARLDRAETINQLTKSLEESQNQCRQLLHKAASGASEEVAQIRVQMQEALSAQSRAENQCKTLQAELTDVNQLLLRYENALKLGAGKNDLQDPVIRDLNKENWKTPGASGQGETEGNVLALKTELENCLANIKTRRNTETELHLITERLNDEKERSRKIELIAQERENQIFELTQKLEQIQRREYSQDEEYQMAFREMEEMKQGFLEFEQKLKDAEESNEQLQGENAGLRRQMTEMVAEFDEDKRISIEKCRNSVMQLHKDSSNLLREKLQEEHKEQMDAVRKELEATSEELIRVKECYVQLCQETRELEQKIRDEQSRETQKLLIKNQPEAVQQLRHSLEEEHGAELEKVKRELSTLKQSEVEAAVEQQLNKIRENIHKEQEEKTKKAIEEALSTAHKKWEEQIDGDTRKKWIIEKEKEFGIRLKSTMEEARSLWKMEHQAGVQKAVKEARVEWETKYAESSTQDTERAVESALSQARADWLKHEEELRQHEIEQAVEVAITNAVAEARQKWDKEDQVKEVSTQAKIMKERAKWKKEEEEQRAQSIETAVAIAEIKWLELEQVKRSQAVEEALAAVRETWQQEKQRDIELAVENTKRALAVLTEKERQAAVETATKQVEAEMKEENKEAVRMAVEQAKLEWLHNRDDNNNNSTTQNVDLERVKDELWKEFEQLKEMEIRQAVEEERTLWQEESENQKQTAVNEAIQYLEEQYANGLEEFKHKELREALSDAREQWEREEAKDREECVQKRIAAVRENWQKEQFQFTQAEIDRALKTAREAWAANHREELEEKLLQATKHAHREMEDRLADEKKKVAESVRKATEKQFEKEKLHFENELEESKKQMTELEKELQQLIQSADIELEDRLRIAREEATAEHNVKVEQAIEEAKKHWEEEQEEERIQLEEQYQQKIKLTVESARKEWIKEHEDTVKTSCHEAVRKQQELWSNERRSDQSVVSRLRDDVQKMKKEHGVALQKLRKDLLQEKVKTKHNQSRRDSRDYSTQTQFSAESESDTSFGSVDQLTAAQGLHELRQHYLDTVAKLREDVMGHINQTKANAAKKIRSEVLKERHTTAKKLRKYYLQCLKQLLEEDRAALSKNGTTSSDAIKLKRMANALKIPESAEKTEQHQKQEEEAIEGTPLGNRRTHDNKVKSSQPVNEHGFSKNYLTSELIPQSKPRDFGIDDGNVTDSSDTSLRDMNGHNFKSNERDSDDNTKQNTFSRILKSKVGKRDTHFPGSRPKAYSPEGDSDPAALGPRRAKKIASLTNGTTRKPINEQIVDRGRLLFGGRTSGKEPANTDNVLRRSVNDLRNIEHNAKQDQEEDRVATKEQRGWGTGRVTALSPTFSALSYESEQYSELPTVICVTPKRNIDSSPSVNARSSRNTRGQYALSSTQDEDVSTPVLHVFRDKNLTAARVSRLKPKENSLPTSPLPSKPLIATNSVNGKTK